MIDLTSSQPETSINVDEILLPVTSSVACNSDDKTPPSKARNNKPYRSLQAFMDSEKEGVSATETLKPGECAVIDAKEDEPFDIDWAISCEDEMNNELAEEKVGI